MRRKWNTFNDFIDVTEFLVARGYGARDRVFAAGGSAGGLLVGVIANAKVNDLRSNPPPIMYLPLAQSPEVMRSLQVRFSAPFLPGETLRTEIWQEAGMAHFRSSALERNTVVLNYGSARITG